jgi:hypothetical protein
MEQWRNYSFLIAILLLGFSTSCEKTELDDIDDIINNNQNEIPQVSPTSQYKTSFENHEWNSGWYGHRELYGNGGTSDAQTMGVLTYFDYGNDGDQDVFFHAQAEFHDDVPNSQFFQTFIIENKGTVGGVTQWKRRKDVISEILPNGQRIPSGGRKITQSDIDNDGDTDFVFFVSDDNGYYFEGRDEGPAGGIYAYIYDETTKMYSPIEIEPYQSGGNQFFYHGGSLGDVNGDGLVDIIAGTVKITIWMNQGNLNFQKVEPFIYENGFICSSTLFDINQDGYLDLITSNSGGNSNNVNADPNYRWNDIGVIVYGKGEYPYFDSENPVTLTSIEESQNYDCMFDVSITDWDNDGDYDLFTSTYGVDSDDSMYFSINYFENNNNTLTNKTKEIFEGNQNEKFANNSGLIKAWDIDNDGNKELLIEGSSDWYSSQQGWNSFKLINGKLTRTKL